MSLFVLGFLDNTRGPLYPQILTDLNLNSSMGSFIFVIPSTLSFVGSYCSQFFVQKLASITGVLLGAVFMVFSYLIFSYADNLFILATCLAFFGLGIGITSVFEHVSIQKAASEKTRRKWLSGLHTIYAFASLVAPFLIQYGLKEGKVWRDFFREFSLMSLAVLFILTLVFIFYRKKDLAMPLKGRDLGATTTMTSKKPIILVSTFVAFYVVAEISIATRVTQLLTEDYNYSLAEAAKYVTYFFMFLFIGRLFFTFVSFARLGAEKLLITAHCISLVFFAIGLFVNPFFLVLCGLSMAPCYALNMDYIASVYQSSATKVMAQAMSATSLVVMLAHYFIGVLTDMYSVKIALLFPILLLFISLCSLVLFHNKYYKGHLT